MQRCVSTEIFEVAKAMPPKVPIELDAVVDGVLNNEHVVLTGLFDGDGGDGLTLGKPDVAKLILRAGGEVKGSIGKKKPPKYLVVGADPGKTKLEQAKAAGVKLITAKGLATVLSGSTEAVEEANLHGVQYSRGYQPPALESGGGADFLGEQPPRSPPTPARSALNERAAHS